MIYQFAYRYTGDRVQEFKRREAETLAPASRRKVQFSCVYTPVAHTDVFIYTSCAHQCVCMGQLRAPVCIYIPVAHTGVCKKKIQAPRSPDAQPLFRCPPKVAGLVCVCTFIFFGYKSCLYSSYTSRVYIRRILVVFIFFVY